jgi:hypothetical protein
VAQPPRNAAINIDEALEEVDAEGAAIPYPGGTGGEVAEELAVGEEGVLTGNSTTE